MRPPLPDEAGALTELVLRSKAAWGYDETFMRACRSELTITRAMVNSERMMAAALANEPIGLAELSVRGDVAELVKLFVDPQHMRTGAGRRLFAWGVELARLSGARTLIVESDPHAAGFYRRMGMVDDGEMPSGSIKGRMLPRLTLDLLPLAVGNSRQ